MKILPALFTFGLCRTGREARALLSKEMVFVNGHLATHDTEVVSGDVIRICKQVARAVVTEEPNLTATNTVTVLSDGSIVDVPIFKRD